MSDQLNAQPTEPCYYGPCAKCGAVHGGWEPCKLTALGGCNCYFKAPTVPTCRSPETHLDDCPAKGSGYPVGVFLSSRHAAPTEGSTMSMKLETVIDYASLGLHFAGLDPATESATLAELRKFGTLAASAGLRSRVLMETSQIEEGTARSLRSLLNDSTSGWQEDEREVCEARAAELEHRAEILKELAKEVGCIHAAFASAQPQETSVEAINDRELLDWLTAEGWRYDPVAQLTVKRNYDRSGSEWVNVTGNVRAVIAAARAAHPQETSADG